MKKKLNITNVKNFWDRLPLFTDEVKSDRKFFSNVYSIYTSSNFLNFNEIKKKVYFPKNKSSQILDAGCGIGFWEHILLKLEYKNIIACDISKKSLQIAKRFCKNKKVKFKFENLEILSFRSNFFDHVNCQGVIHHSPNYKKCFNEISRVLKKNGTCSISVYYTNFFLKYYSFFYPIIKFLSSAIFSKKISRSRDFSKLPKNKKKLVRLFDGKDNPLGISFSYNEFLKIIDNKFSIISVNYYFFPARFLSFNPPFFIKKILLFFFPFLIIFNLKKN